MLMKFSKQRLIDNAKARLAENQAWEDGKAAERRERRTREIGQALVKQRALVEVLDVLQTELTNTSLAGMLMPREDVQNIFRRFKTLSDNVSSYHLTDLDSYILSSAEISKISGDDKPTPAYLQTKNEMEHLLSILDLVSGDDVSTYALRQAGYSGPIPTGRSAE